MSRFLDFFTRSSSDSLLDSLNEVVIAGMRIPVEIIQESRRDCRVSIAKRGIIIRLAHWIPKKEKEKQARELLDWAENRIQKDGWPYAESLRLYEHGDRMSLGGEIFTILVSPEPGDSVRAEMEPGILRFWVGAELEGKDRSDTMSKVAAKLAMQYFQDFVEERVAELNDLHFQQDYDRVKLKHNKSNWGSCSIHGNLALNVRLLFAPLSVLDYVIIHELAHLIEHNHSPDFWALVEEAEPNYKEHVDWLKEHGPRCVF